jgi:hypothetical protein
MNSAGDEIQPVIRAFSLKEEMILTSAKSYVNLPTRLLIKACACMLCMWCRPLVWFEEGFTEEVELE